MQSLPPDFRAKHDQLLTVTDSRTGNPVTDSLGPPADGFQPYPSGGGRFEFRNGALYSFDHTGRFPVVAVWGPISRYYKSLGGIDGGFGRPLTDVTDLSDGGRCCIFEGGHIHEYGDKAAPYPASQCVATFKPFVPPFPFDIGPAGMPAVFHQKWIGLSLQKDPDGYPIIEHLKVPCHKLNENPNGGQRYHFLGGEIVTVDNSTAPVICYAQFFTLWGRLGHLSGGLGHPISDPQPIEGGRCQVFKGGHIHVIDNVAHTCSPDQCTIKYGPTTTSWNKMPPHFQRKWTALCSVVHPHTRATIAEMLGVPCHGLSNNPKGMSGQHFHFLQASLVSLSMNPDATPYTTPKMSPGNPPNFYPPNSSAGDYNPYGIVSWPQQIPSPSNLFPRGPEYVPGVGSYGLEGKPLVLIEPFYVVGAICNFWRKAGGLESTYGRPLCDEQDLPDGGRCSIFEGAHIHLYNGEARGVAAQHCTAPYQPTAAPAPALVSPNWPAQQPAPQPPMTSSQPPPAQPVPEKKPGGCMDLIKMCCVCKVETHGSGGVCKMGECVCCTWSVH